MPTQYPSKEKKVVGLSGWFKSLIGKSKQVQSQPRPLTQEITNQQQGQVSSPQTQNQEVPEDSVAADLEAFKSFTKKTASKISQKVTPIATKGAAKTTQTITSASSLIDKTYLKKLIRVFLILVFLIILAFIVFNLFRTIEENGGGKPDGTVETIATPTPFPYLPYKPSIYSDDPEVLKLEEELNVLEKELARTSIREDTLIPPTLDYDINFK